MSEEPLYYAGITVSESREKAVGSYGGTVSYDRGTPVTMFHLWSDSPVLNLCRRGNGDTRSRVNVDVRLMWSTSTWTEPLDHIETWF